MNWQQVTPYIVPLLVVMLIARRAFRAQTPKRVRPSRLWIGPVYVAAAMALVLWQSPMPGAFGMMLFAIGAMVGGGVGYLRALHQEFSIDPETGNVRRLGRLEEPRLAGRRAALRHCDCGLRAGAWAQFLAGIAFAATR